MKKLFSSKTFLLHAVFIVLLGVLSVIYCKPILEKKRLVQHDIVMSMGAAQEVLDYQNETGEYSAWTNSMFGGMPSYTVKGSYPNSWTSYVASKISYIFPDPANYIFLLLIGMYIGLVALRFSPLLAFMGAVAFGFSSYTLISLEAGHVSKVLAIAYAVPLIIGVLLTLRGRYLIGGILSLIFLSFELYSNHIQITYYIFLALLIIGVYEGIHSILSKELKQFLYGGLLLVGIAVIITGATSTRFATLIEYTPFSTRGPGELTSLDATANSSGLDREYAFNWSYGKMETFTYLIPNFKGGKSGAALDMDSKTYKLIDKNYGAENARKIGLSEQWPIYWGDQPGTSGAAYMGAIICLLALIGLFVIKSNFKWVLLGIIVFFSILAMGKNSEDFNYLMFDYFPGYNKFRAVTMIHSLVAIFMVWLAVWGLEEFLKSEKKDYIKILKVAGGGLIGLLLFFTLMGSSIFTFEKSDDVQAEASKKEYISSWTKATENPTFGEDMYDALIQDRKDAFTSDALRSLILVALASGILFLFVYAKLKKEYVIVALIILIVFDQWQVSKRYLNEKDFKKKKSVQSELKPSAADEQILADKDPNFRVMNVTVSTFNDASTSYFHKSIGGYSAAKMHRYQDLIDRQISKNNMNVLNMLNAKYFIVQNPQTGEPIAQRNPSAYGNAWFVREVKIVDNADAEMKALDSTDLRNVAIADKRFASDIKTKMYDVDSNSTINLTSYKPNELVYEANSAKRQFAVFSEIYYVGNDGWEAFVNGVPVNHVRVDYVLRGLELPAGENKIVFKFVANTHKTFETVSLICSILALALTAGFIVMYIKKKDK